MDVRAPVQTTPLRVVVSPTRVEVEGIEDSDVETLARALRESQDLTLEHVKIRKT